MFVISLKGSNSSTGDESQPMLRIPTDISRQPSVKEVPEEEETPTEVKPSPDPSSGVASATGDKVPPRHVKVSVNPAETKVSVEELNRKSIGG